MSVFRPPTAAAVSGLCIFLAIVTAAPLVHHGWLFPLKAAFTQHWSMLDFWVAHLAAIDLRAGRNHYRDDPATLPSTAFAAAHGIPADAYGYTPAVELVVYLPLTYLPFAWAKAVWLTVNFILVWLSIGILTLIVAGRGDGTVFALLTAVVAGCAATTRSLQLGQNTIPMLFLLALGLRAWQRGWDGVGGALIGAAVLFKPIPLILLPALLLRKRWRAVAGCLALLVAAVAVSALVFGADLTFSYFRVYRQSSGPALAWGNQSLAGVCGRFLTVNPYTTPLLEAPLLGVAGYALAVALILGAAVWRSRRVTPADLPVELSLWLVAGMLISSRCWDHYLVWLVIPFALLLGEYLRAGRRRAMAGLAIAYALANVPGIGWKDNPAFHAGPLLLLTGLQTLALVVVFILLLTVRRPPADPDGGAAP